MFKQKAPESYLGAAGAAKADDDDDDDVDLFGSDDDEEEDAEAAKVREERLAAYAGKQSIDKFLWKFVFRISCKLVYFALNLQILREPALREFFTAKLFCSSII